MRRSANTLHDDTRMGYEDKIEEMQKRISELEEELNARKEQLGYLQAAYNELKGRINRGEI